MKRKYAINVAFGQSVIYLIIGVFLGLIPWSEHRYIGMAVLLLLVIAAHYIAKYLLEEKEDAIQYNNSEER